MVFVPIKDYATVYQNLEYNLPHRLRALLLFGTTIDLQGTTPLNMSLEDLAFPTTPLDLPPSNRAATAPAALEALRPNVSIDADYANKLRRVRIGFAGLIKFHVSTIPIR